MKTSFLIAWILTASIIVIAACSLPLHPPTVTVAPGGNGGVTVCSTFDRVALYDAGVR